MPEDKHVLVNGVWLVEGFAERLIQAQEITQYVIDGKSYSRIPYGSEPSDWGASKGPCHDCAAVVDQYHLPGCDVERCPKCGGQSISCDCDEAGARDSEAIALQLSQADAVQRFLKSRPHYEQLCEVAKNILKKAIERKNVKVQSIEGRAKSLDSFLEKISKPSEIDPEKPKYSDPFNEITDLAGVRVITYFPATVRDVDDLIVKEFQIVERSDKGEKLVDEERFGYNSIHYLVKISENRATLPEYERFSGSIVEIQVRTVLQHAWAEIEHDIQYKSSSVIPTDIRRRFVSLAGMLEIADREFQAIQDDDKKLRELARHLIKTGDIDQVEITPDALKAFLAKTIGPDGRIVWQSYDGLARTLRKLGFKTLGQLEEVTKGIDGDHLSKLVFGSRQGQIYRFELMLMAGMGELFIMRHPLAEHAWFRDWRLDTIEKLRLGGISIGSFDPTN